MTEENKRMLNKIIYDEEVSVEDFIKYLKKPKFKIHYEHLSSFEMRDFIESIEDDIIKDLKEDITRFNSRDDVLQYATDIMQDLIDDDQMTTELAFEITRFLISARIDF